MSCAFCRGLRRFRSQHSWKVWAVRSEQPAPTNSGFGRQTGCSSVWARAGRWPAEGQRHLSASHGAAAPKFPDKNAPRDLCKANAYPQAPDSKSMVLRAWLACLAKASGALLASSLSSRPPSWRLSLLPGCPCGDAINEWVWCLAGRSVRFNLTAAMITTVALSTGMYHGEIVRWRTGVIA